MKNYKIIIPPIPLDFSNRTKKELKIYYTWYIDIMSERLEQLIKIIKDTPGYKDWNANYSPKSLEKLGRWFYENIEIRKRTKKEKDEIYNNAKEWFKQVEIQNWQLTTQTLSLVFDIGMYLINVFIKNNSKLRIQHQITGSKKDSNYGKPVIIGFKFNMAFDATEIASVLAYGFADKTSDWKELKEVYYVWINDYM